MEKQPQESHRRGLPSRCVISLFSSIGSRLHSTLEFFILVDLVLFSEHAKCTHGSKVKTVLTSQPQNSHRPVM